MASIAPWSNSWHSAGSNFLFFILFSSDEERKRHDKGIEELHAAQAEWLRKRTERLDFIHEELRRQGNAVQTFRDVDAAIREYLQVTGHNIDSLGPES